MEKQITICMVEIEWLLGNGQGRYDQEIFPLVVTLFGCRSHTTSPPSSTISSQLC